ncbi:MAG: VTC domain-containing protein [Treponema sp.]|jgi:hypothetical protein|nr:VTC domain-containing protein [Treponema sp.]
MQTIFERYENKYLISRDQADTLVPFLSARMTPDRYASYSVASVYYDTPDYSLIRRSLEKPVYREKLRLRCYGSAGADTTVFLELKKKYKKRVYKRRIGLPYALARDFPTGGWESAAGNSGAIPLWLCRLLSGQNIFPASFSKYGTCYAGFIKERAT